MPEQSAKPPKARSGTSKTPAGAAKSQKLLVIVLLCAVALLSIAVIVLGYLLIKRDHSKDALGPKPETGVGHVEKKEDEKTGSTLLLRSALIKTPFS